MNKVYISGKISGLPEQEYKRNFAEAEKKLRLFNYIPINPAKIGIVPGFKWEDYMKESLKLLCDCDFIYFLPDSDDSRGVAFERQTATILGIPTLNIQTLDKKWD